MPYCLMSAVRLSLSLPLSLSLSLSLSPSLSALLTALREQAVEDEQRRVQQQLSLLLLGEVEGELVAAVRRAASLFEPLASAEP